MAQAAVDALVSLGFQPQQAAKLVELFATGVQTDTITANWTLSGTINVTGTFQLDGVVMTASAAELNRVADVSARLVGAGNALAVTLAVHDGKTILMDQADGSALTLLAATGSGARIRVVVSVTVTSNAHSIAAAGTDEFVGHCYQVDTDTGDAIAAYPALGSDNFDTISMNGSTTGGLQGDIWELEDIAAGVWAVRGLINSTGAVATPFSAS